MRLLVALWLFVTTAVQGATINAASTSSSDVQTAVDSASDGDTVIVPAGSATWSTRVTVVGKAITLQGGDGTMSQVVITRNNDVGHSILRLDCSSSKLVVCKGFEFRTTPSSQFGIVNIDGTLQGSMFRLTACKFVCAPTNSTVGNHGLYIFDAYGVIDNCTFVNTENGGQSISIENNTGSNAATLWNTPQSTGDDKSCFIEDCTFTNTFTGDGAIDAYDGAKFVFRYNTVTNTIVGWHGADSSPRSPRLWEIYNNTFTTSISIYTVIRARGGTGVIHNNTATTTGGGSYDNFIFLSHYSAEPGYSRNTYGTSPGTADGNWNNSRPGMGYPSGYPLLDQIGRGSFPANPPNGGWPNTATGTGYSAANYEADDPAYFWGNTFLGDTSPDISIGLPDESQTYIVEGRDFFGNTAKPGYSAYAYPHPLRDEASGNSSVSFSGSGASSFSGSGTTTFQ